MPTLSIKPNRQQGGQWFRYVFKGEAHDGGDKRALLSAGTHNVEGLSPDDALKVFKLERQAAPSQRRKVNAYQGFISFGANEFSDGDEQQALDYALEFLNEQFAGYSAYAGVQNDGKGGKMHVHFIVNNVNDEGKALRGSQKSWLGAKKTNDEIAIKHNLTPITVKKEPGEYDWRLDLKNRLEGAKNGVKTKTRTLKSGEERLSFNFIDEQGKSRSIRAGRLESELNLPTGYFAGLDNQTEKEAPKMDFEDIMPTFEEPEDDLGVITPEKPKTAKNDKNLAFELLNAQNELLTPMFEEQKSDNTVKTLYDERKTKKDINELFYKLGQDQLKEPKAAIDEAREHAKALGAKEQKGKQLAGMTFGRAALIGWDMVESKPLKEAQNNLEMAQARFDAVKASNDNIDEINKREMDEQDEKIKQAKELEKERKDAINQGLNNKKALKEVIDGKASLDDVQNRDDIDIDELVRSIDLDKKRGLEL